MAAPVAAGLTTALVVGREPLRAHLGDLADRVVSVTNPHPERGQASSVAAGLCWAASAGHEAVVVGLADQPLIEASAWSSLAQADGELVVATYGGRRGNPVRLGSSVWPLLPRQGDAVGRAVMQVRPELVQELACDGDPFDVDTAADLRRLGEMSRPQPDPSTTERR